MGTNLLHSAGVDERSRQSINPKKPGEQDGCACELDSLLGAPNGNLTKGKARNVTQEYIASDFNACHLKELPVRVPGYIGHPSLVLAPKPEPSGLGNKCLIMNGG